MVGEETVDTAGGKRIMVLFISAGAVRARETVFKQVGWWVFKKDLAFKCRHQKVPLSPSVHGRLAMHS